MRAKGVRGIAILIAVLSVLAGCGNFTLSGLLDSPPDIPPGPRSLALAPSTVNAETSSVVQFTVSGGSGSYTWTEDTDSGLVDGAGRYTVPALAGTYTVTVRDNGTDETRDATVFATTTIPLAISPTTVTLPAGGGFTFSATGGTGIYLFVVSPDGTVGTINASGEYTAPPIVGIPNTDTVVVTSGSESRTAIITLTEPPLLGVSPAEITLVAGSTYTFTASGGVPLYNWTVTPDGNDGAIDPTGLYTAPLLVGVPPTDTIRLRDASGGVREAFATVTLIAPPPGLTINPNPATVGAGQTLTFVASGGVVGTGYVFSILSGGGTVNSATGEYEAPLFGGVARVSVTDHDTPPTTVDVPVSINPPPALQITPPSLLIQTDSQASFSATGGTPTYTWDVIPEGGAGGWIDATALYTAPSAEGTYTVRVTDSSLVRSMDAVVKVYSPLTIIPIDAAVQTGGIYTFSASGGVPGPGYTYSVVEGNPGGTVDATGKYTAPGLAGTYHVKVEDSIGHDSIATVAVIIPAGWNIVSIDSAARSGQYASLALTAGGLPRIAYYESQGKELRFASFDGSLWTQQVVDTDMSVGKYASLALQPGSGHARISYYDEKKGELQYAAWNGSTWTRQIVDSAGDVGQYASLALDPVGPNYYPRIAYYDATAKDLKYASWNGSAWTSQVVDSTGDVGQDTSLAFDPAGNPHIAYYSVTAKDLKYAAWNGSAWIMETVDSTGDVGQYASLALEPGTGRPRIAYYDVTTNKLKYVEKNGASWGAPQVVYVTTNDVGKYASLALDPVGPNYYPRIAYYDATAKDLKYASWDGSAWVIETVESAGDVGKFGSLKLDPTTSRPRIACYNGTAQDLKFAEKP
jgi:hypothetical protein